MKVEGKKWLVKRAVCFARALGVYDFMLKITNEPGGSWCVVDDYGIFTINIEEDLVTNKIKYVAAVHLAHEMVHLKQFKHDELREVDGVTYWKGEPQIPTEYMSDGYFFSPCEMEARALEDWLMHKWETRKNELH